MIHRDFYDSAIVRKAYTAKKLLDLAFLIQAQVTKVYARNGMVFPVSCSSTLLHLSKNGPASVTEVARALEHPHQTVAQHLATLSKLQVIEKRTDAADRRRTEYFLTEFGTAQATSLCASTEQPKRNFLIRKIFRPASSDRHFATYPQFGNPNYPDGGVNASARDLTMLAQSMLAGGKTRSGHLLSTASFAEMLKLQLPPSIDDRQRFFWRDRNGLIGHAGSDQGVYTSLYFDTAKGNAIVVLMNRTPDLQTEQAMARLFDRINRDLLRP